MKGYKKIQEQGYLSIANNNANRFRRLSEYWSDIKVMKENRGKNRLGFDQIVFVIYGKKVK